MEAPSILDQSIPRTQCLFGPWLGLAGLLLAGSAAADLRATPDTYLQLVPQLRAGDVLRLQGGIYTAGLRLHDLQGRPDAPIVIEGPTAGAPAVFRARDGHNTVSLANASHLVVRNLVLDGNGTRSGAVKAEGFEVCDYTHHVTLERLTIVGHGQHQQQVGISTKCPAWGWVIRDNTIIGAGTGIYLGNSDGNAPFFHGLIEGNVVVDTLGYNLQVKHQLPRPVDLPGMPTERGATVIRHNFFGKARGGADPRPNVLLGHFPQAGPGLEDEYPIYGNVFWQNPQEALFQGEGNLLLYDNLFVNDTPSEFPAIAIQPHQAVPRRVRVVDNIFRTAGERIRIRDVAPGCEAVVSE